MHTLAPCALFIEADEPGLSTLQSRQPVREKAPAFGTAGAGGDYGDTDVYGAQQHAPLLNVEIPVNVPVK